MRLKAPLICHVTLLCSVLTFILAGIIPSLQTDRNFQYRHIRSRARSPLLYTSNNDNTDGNITSLTKRAPSNELHFYNSYVLEFIRPVQPAARALRIFYDQILYHALYVWSSQPTHTSWVIRYGAFECIMFAAGGQVTWEFVAEFARMMSAATTMGFTSTYLMNWTNANRDHTVRVALAVRSTAQMMEALERAGLGTLMGHPATQSPPEKG
ncbi:MAG: hypothetical protein Q9166_008104 [cf. Caloplaca sp. 2 TL-2023]